MGTSAESSTVQTYWATDDSDALAAAVTTRVNQWYNYLRGSLRLDLWNRCYRAHHSGGLEYGRIFTSGVSGEQILLKANHLRSINQHIVNGITAERPAFEAKAVNADFESMTQTILGQQILDYDVFREKKLEVVSREAVEYATVYGEGFITKLWNATGGTMVGRAPKAEGEEPEAPGRPIWSGTLEFRAVAPWDAVRDFTEDDPRKIQWYIVREFVNKYDLAAKYKEKEQDVFSAPGRLESYASHPIAAFNDLLVQKAWKYSDEVECFHFFHAKTDSLPHGRYMLLAGTHWLQDGPLPYKRMPVFRISAGQQPGTAFGYSINFDLLPIAHAINAQYATIATNQAAFGIQSVAVPIGANLTPKQIGTGLAMLEFQPIPGIEGGGMPVPLNLTKTAPESFTWLARLVEDVQLISGVNSTQRGQPGENIKSGSMAALVVAQALTFTVNLQASYIEALESCSTGAIEDYVTFAELPQVALIAGKGNAGYMKTFKGKDLNLISRVVVDVSNPLLKTIAGRMEVANHLLGQKLITTPEQYIMVVTTGRLEPVIEGQQAELLNIRAENEELQAGRPVPVLATDMHPLHIRSHKSVVANPASRAMANSATVKATLQHIMDHVDKMKTTDPDLLTIIGVPPLHPPPPPAQESQAAFAAELSTATTPGAKGEIEAAHDVYKVAGPPQIGLPPAPQGPGSAPMPRMPSAPRNPANGQKANVPPTPANVTPQGVRPASTNK